MDPVFSRGPVDWRGPRIQVRTPYLTVFSCGRGLSQYLEYSGWLAGWLVVAVDPDLAMNPVCCRGSVSLYLPWALYLEYSGWLVAGWWLAGGWLVTWLCYFILVGDLAVAAAGPSI